MITSSAQRWRDQRASYRPAGEVINTRAFEVAPIEGDAAARAFVEREHYSGTYPAARRRFGLYRTSGELAGVAVFSVPARVEVLRPLPGGLAAGADLGRLVLLDDVPGNGETWFVARCRELLAREGFEGCVMFSDPHPRTTRDGRVVFGGHIGGLYQGLNAVALERSHPDTIYLLDDGRTFPRRALDKIRTRDSGWRYAVAQLVASGAPAPEDDADLGAWLAAVLPVHTRKVRHPGNLKYVLPFTPAAARAVRRAVGEGRPYPKLCDVGLCAGRASTHRPNCARRAA